VSDLADLAGTPPPTRLGADPFVMALAPYDDAALALIARHGRIAQSDAGADDGD